MPRIVEFEISLDGKIYVPVLSIPNDVPDGSSRDQSVAVTKDFVRLIPETAARFVRVRAVNFGKIPSWHPGSGSDAWVFADEIIIE